MPNTNTADTFATVETEDGEVYIGCIVPIDNYTCKMQTDLRRRTRGVEPCAALERR